MEIESEYELTYMEDLCVHKECLDTEKDKHRN